MKQRDDLVSRASLRNHDEATRQATLECDGIGYGSCHLQAAAIAAASRRWHAASISICSPSAGDDSLIDPRPSLTRRSTRLLGTRQSSA